MNELTAMLKSVREVGGDAVNLIEALAGGFRPGLSKGQVLLAQHLIDGEGGGTLLGRPGLGDDMLTRILIGEVQPGDGIAMLIATLSGGAVRPETFVEPAKIEPRGRLAGATLPRPVGGVAGTGEVRPPAFPVLMPSFRVSRGRAVLELGPVMVRMDGPQLEALVAGGQIARDQLAQQRPAAR